MTPESMIEEMPPKGQRELDAMKCPCHPDKPVELQSPCHPGRPMLVTYTSRVLFFHCAKCKRVVETIWVGEAPPS
jgi:hypothetical protein